MLSMRKNCSRGFVRLLSLVFLVSVLSVADVPVTSRARESAQATIQHGSIGVVSQDAVFKDAQHDEYTVVLFYRRADRRPSANMPNITLVSHATLDRLPAVARWCRTLKGPMSISVFVRPLIEDVAATMAAFAADACIARHADLHLVREKNHTYDASFDGSGKDMMTHYPFNVQRNAALDGCVGQLALLMDIDFHLMPVPNTREVDIRRHLEAQKIKVAAWSFLDAADLWWVLDAAVYVIPAVETMNTDVELPRTLSQLRTAFDSHQVLPFYHTCRTCHLPSDLRRFVRPATTDPYLAEFDEGYEPYVILNRSSRTPHCPSQVTGVPSYDEMFVGRGWDKMSFFYELNLQRRPFIVLPKYFLVHHGKGDMPKFVSTEYMRRQEVNRALMGRFKETMAEKYSAALVTTATAGIQLEGGGDISGGGESCQSPELQTKEQCVLAPTSEPSNGKEVLHTSSAPIPSPFPERRITDDDLVWRAVGNRIQWDDLTPSLGFPSRCVAKLRPSEATSNPEAAAGLREFAVGLCHRHPSLIDCSPLGAPHSAAPRVDDASVALPSSSLPASLLADWVFDRIYHLNVSRGADPASACDFAGNAALLSVSAESAATDSEQSSSSPMYFGCTVDRDACMSRDEAAALLAALCGESSHGANDIPLPVLDVIGRLTPEQCRIVGSSLDPLLADDLVTRLSAVLNVHHHLYHGVPRRWGVGARHDVYEMYKTCTEQFGSIAALVKKPERQLEHH